jgi:hypothetical protein
MSQFNTTGVSRSSIGAKTALLFSMCKFGLSIVYDR